MRDRRHVFPLVNCNGAQLQLMICRVPSLPRTPGSVGLGLRSRPFFRLKNESIPLLPGLPLLPAPSSPSAGRVELWSASSLQLPDSSRTICTPPPLLGFRRVPRCCRGPLLLLGGGKGRWKDGAGVGEPDVWLEGEGGCAVASLARRFSALVLIGGACFGGTCGGGVFLDPDSGCDDWRV